MICVLAAMSCTDSYAVKLLHVCKSSSCYLILEERRYNCVQLIKKLSEMLYHQSLMWPHKVDLQIIITRLHAILKSLHLSCKIKVHGMLVFST